MTFSGNAGKKKIDEKTILLSEWDGVVL